MTQEIIDGNRFIAEFMGWKFNKERKAYYIPQTLGFPFKGKVEDLKYHKDWNWIMPVVIKCFDVYCDVEGVSVFNADNQQFKLNDALLLTDINALWLAVIEFIEWYNQNKPIRGFSGDLLNNPQPITD